MTAVTAITAQNTTGVRSVHPIPPETIVAQVRAVADDIGVDAVKIGMLGTRETIAAVESALELLPGVPVVLDPVMIAESGALLLDEDARAALVTRLLPRAAVTTPNLSEARVLAAETGSVDSEAKQGGTEPERPVGEAERLARAIHALGPETVVVTGGHCEQPADLFFDGSSMVAIEGERHPAGASHGSGCTHSSALAAGLALGASPLEAARSAKAVAAVAVRDGLREVGAGVGPVDALGLRHRSAAGPLP
jgi:hydroxymethylpyrimidine/phosphomethylpyrimidine kinase